MPTAEPRPTPLDRLWRMGLRVAWRAVNVWYFVARPRSLRGVCVAVWLDGRLLTVEHSYKEGLGLPAGGRRRRETPAEAAARELSEEVGIRVAPDALRHVFDLPCRWRYAEELVHYFELELEEAPAVRIDRREVSRAAFRHPDELEEEALLLPVRNFLRELRRRGYPTGPVE